MAREMKDSGIEWIGEIPVSWQVTKIKYFYDCYDGRRIPVDSELRKKGPYPYWGAGSITDYVDEYLFDEELVLLGEDGAPFFDHTRPVAFLINEKVWVNNHIHVLKAKPSVNSKFLVYWLNNVDYRTYINGSILNKLTQSNMNSIAFAFPPIEEQSRISLFLDTECSRIDSVIEQTRASIEEYKKLKQAVITQAVTKGIRPRRKMKDSGIEWIGEIPSEWSVSKLGVACEAMIVPMRDKPVFVEHDTGIPWCRIEDLEGKYLFRSKSSRFLTREIINEMNLKVVPENTVLSACSAASVGAVGIVKTPCCTNQTFIGLVAGTDLYYEFLYYYMFMIKPILISLGMGATIVYLSKDIYKKIPMPMPCLCEQKEIVDYLNEQTDAIDVNIDNKCKMIEELINFKKSLIYEYVTGKKEVPV